MDKTDGGMSTTQVCAHGMLWISGSSYSNRAATARPKLKATKFVLEFFVLGQKSAG